jgi:hypothetical protein
MKNQAATERAPSKALKLKRGMASRIGRAGERKAIQGLPGARDIRQLWKPPELR